MKKFLIIVAGGSGKRMNSALPKQFILVNNKPIILYSIEKFIAYNPKIEIIISLQKSWFDYWKQLCVTQQFDHPHQLAEAGKERFDTVKNALQFLSDSKGLVAIHDAVRPMVSVETIARCFDGAANNGNSIPVIPLTDSIRKITKYKNKALDRNNYFAVQTPQCFDVHLIRKAYNQSFENQFTDDSSVVEALGEKIFSVQGNIENKKITAPSDLILAENLLKN